MGWLGIASAFFILFFYCALGGYCIKYVVLNVGDLFNASFGSNVFAEAAAASGSSTGAAAWAARQCPHLRADTHAANLTMRHCMERAGFVYCGVIYVADGTPRVAYEKV